MLSYLTANTLMEIICLLFSTLCLSTDKSLVWRSMILYLLITCITELGGIAIGRHSHNNHWVYNIFIVFEAGFTHLMFVHLFKNYKHSKSIILIGLAVFVIFYIYDTCSHGFFKYNNLTYTILSVEFVLYSLYYYYLLLKDENYIDLKKSPEFWWVAGTIFFYFANTACNLFDAELYSVMITSHHHLTYFIFKILNIILYGCWSYSFICKRWLSKTSPS